jgi:Secretion system C-terminal sorting domain
VDASDLGSAPLPGCVKLNLQILPDQSGWAVVAKPISGFAPSATTTLEAGRVTIVTPKDFEFGGFQTGSSPWEATTVLATMPNNPNRKYITFELAGNSAPLSLIPGQETVLFKFDKLGDCPKSLAILENTTAAGPIPNELSGTTSYGVQENSFNLCGVYNRKAWKCKGQNGTPPIIVVVPPDSLGTPPITDRDADFYEENIAEGKQWFTASPNPAGDFVNITVSADLAEGRTTTLSLWDVQGKKRQEVKVENASTQLNLSGLPAGVYLVSLAQNGQVVQREKLLTAPIKTHVT